MQYLMGNKLISAILSLVVVSIACKTVPVTGRRQLNLVPAAMIKSPGAYRV
jgi:hypothetical protein